MPPQPALPLQSSPPKPGRGGELQSTWKSGHHGAGVIETPSDVLAPPRGKSGICTDGCLRVAGLPFQHGFIWTVTEPVPAGCIVESNRTGGNAYHNNNCGSRVPRSVIGSGLPSSHLSLQVPAGPDPSNVPRGQFNPSGQIWPQPSLSRTSLGLSQACFPAGHSRPVCLLTYSPTIPWGPAGDLQGWACPTVSAVSLCVSSFLSH